RGRLKGLESCCQDGELCRRIRGCLRRFGAIRPLLLPHHAEDAPRVASELALLLRDDGRWQVERQWRLRQETDREVAEKLVARVPGDADRADECVAGADLERLHLDDRAELRRDLGDASQQLAR